MTEQLPTPVNPQSTSTVLSDTAKALAEALTGIAASSRRELALSIGYIFQRLRGGEFLATVSREWERYREKGRIKPDYDQTEQHKVCLQELLDFLDKDSPDAIRFDALKKIFLVAATENIEPRESLLPQQYMRVARTLTDGELLVLFACYRIYKDDRNTSWKQEQIHSAGDWLESVAAQSGLRFPELVEFHEQGLEAKRLISSRLHSDRSGVKVKPAYRLTKLGVGLCEFIAAYDGDTQQPLAGDAPQAARP
jgi:hypothetical protein